MSAITAVKENRKKVLEEAKGLNALLETRELTPEEQERLDKCMAEVASYSERLNKLEQFAEDYAKASADDDDKDKDDDSNDAEGEVNEEGTERAKPKTNTRSKRSLPASTRDFASYKEYLNRRETRYCPAKVWEDLADRRQIRGLEAEIDQELTHINGRRSAGMWVPFDLKSVRDKAVRNRVGAFRETRDTSFDTTSGAGAYLTDPVNDTYIEWFYNVNVTAKLKCNLMTGLTQQRILVRQSSTTTAQIVADGSVPTALSPQADSVTLSPRAAMASATITRDMLVASNVNAEQFVGKDLMAQTALIVDAQNFVGTGASPQDYGILYNTSIPSGNVLSLASSTYVATWQQILTLEAELKSQNVPFDDSVAWVTHPFGEQVLKQTAKYGQSQTSNFPLFLVDDRGMLDNYPLIQSVQIPNNFTVSGQSGPFTALILGVFSHNILAQWGDLEIVVNPYTTPGSLIVTTILSYDTALAKPQAFGYTTSLLTHS
jgi:HK97 family phage major capsid protein